MLLSHDEIEDLLDKDIVEYSDPELIDSYSLDIRLGQELLIERPLDWNDIHKVKGKHLNRVVLRERQALTMIRHNLKKDGPFILFPGEFILAHSHEVFNLQRESSGNNNSRQAGIHATSYSY